MPESDTDTTHFNTNEGTQTLKISPELTRLENYLMWKRQMELALGAKKKLGYVTSLEPLLDHEPMMLQTSSIE